MGLVKHSVNTVEDQMKEDKKLSAKFKRVSLEAYRAEQNRINTTEQKVYNLGLCLLT